MFTRCQTHKKLQNNAKKLQCQPASVPEYLLHHCCQQIHIVDPNKIKERKFQKLRVRGRQPDKQTCTQKDRQTGARGQTDRQIDNQADRQSDRQGHMQTDGHADISNKYTHHPQFIDMLPYYLDKTIITNCEI